MLFPRRSLFLCGFAVLLIASAAPVGFAQDADDPEPDRAPASDPDSAQTSADPQEPESEPRAADATLAESDEAPPLLAAGSGDGQVYELEETIVRATRSGTELGRTADAVSIITEDRIERQQARQVQDVLRGVPGLDVVRSGGLGQGTSVFIRGAKSDHTLVLLDGMELNDPSAPSRGFDFANLTTENIERIEVLRGPQSTLWGSDAMGGVINIVTKEGAGEPTLRAGAEGGSFYTAREWLNFSGGHDIYDFSFGASRVDSRGIDATTGGGDRDGYANTSGSFRLGVDPTEQFGVDMSFRANDSRTEIDAAGGMDDPDARLEQRKIAFRIQPRLTLLDGRWEQSLNLGLTDHDRESFNTGFDSAVDGRFYNVDWQHEFELTSNNTLIAGYEYERERFNSDAAPARTAYTHAVYFEDQLRLFDRLLFTAGLRHNEHETFGSETTYRLAAAYRLPETGTKLRASYGTGFKAPSLSNLFGSFVGNPNLEAETSEGFDVGIDQDLLGDDLTASVTWFHNDFDDLIAFDPAAFQLRNADTAETRGVETALRWDLAPNLFTRASYTYTDVDADASNLVIRRAPHKAGLGVGYAFDQQRGRLGLDVTYVSDRDDTNFNTGSTVTLDDYTLLNLTGSYQLTEWARVFGRVENALDEDYHEAFGFNAPQVAAYGGFEVTF